METLQYIEAVERRHASGEFHELLVEEGAVHDVLTLEFAGQPLRSHISLLLDKFREQGYVARQKPWVYERYEYWGFDPRPRLTPDILRYGVIGIKVIANSRTSVFRSELKLTGSERELGSLRLPFGLKLKVQIPVSFQRTAELRLSFHPSKGEARKYLAVLQEILPFQIASSLLVEEETRDLAP